MLIKGKWVGRIEVLDLYAVNQKLQDAVERLAKDNKELREANQHYVQEIEDYTTIVRDIAMMLEKVSQGKYYTSPPDAEERVFEIRLP